MTWKQKQSEGGGWTQGATASPALTLSIIEEIPFEAQGWGQSVVCNYTPSCTSPKDIFHVAHRFLVSLPTQCIFYFVKTERKRSVDSLICVVGCDENEWAHQNLPSLWKLFKLSIHGHDIAIRWHIFLTQYGYTTAEIIVQQNKSPSSQPYNLVEKIPFSIWW